MPVELPSHAVLSQYLRHRINQLLSETGPDGEPVWRQISLAREMKINRSYLSVFLAPDADVGAGPKLVSAILPVLEMTRDQLDREAVKWAKAQRIPVGPPVERYPNRAAAIEFAAGELDERAIEIVRSYAPDADPPRRWWYSRLMHEHDMLNPTVQTLSLRPNRNNSATLPKTTAAGRKR